MEDPETADDADRNSVASRGFARKTNSVSGGKLRNSVQVQELHGDIRMLQPGLAWLTGAVIFVAVVVAVPFLFLRDWDGPPGAGSVVSSTPDPGSGSAENGSCEPGSRAIWSGPHLFCEIDSEVVYQPHAEAAWSTGSTLVVVGATYEIYFANNGGPFRRLDNGVVDNDSKGVEFVETGDDEGYFKVKGYDRKDHCMHFWISADGTPAYSRWNVCG